MYGKREQELATEVMDFWQRIQALPSSPASVTLEAAMQTWVKLVGGGSLAVSLVSSFSSLMYHLNRCRLLGP